MNIREGQLDFGVVGEGLQDDAQEDVSVLGLVERQGVTREPQAGLSGSFGAARREEQPLVQGDGGVLVTRPLSEADEDLQGLFVVR